MRVYFINLDRETERRAHMEQALSGLDHERVAAVDGRANPPTENGLTRFEIACIDSHRAAWTRFLESRDNYAVILEDDVHLSPEFSGFVRDESWIPADVLGIKLETFFNKVLLRPDPAPCMGRGLFDLRSRHEGTAGYLVSRAGAQAFLRVTERPRLPLDYILFPERPWPSGSLLQLSPALVVQDDRISPPDAAQAKFASGIKTTDRKTPSLSGKLRREMLRLPRQIHCKARWLFQRRISRAVETRVEWR